MGQIDAVIAAYLLLFGCWTLLVHLCELAGMGFRTVAILSPGAALAAAGAWLWWRRLKSRGQAIAGPVAGPTAPSEALPRRVAWLGGALAVLAVYAVTGSYPVFWLGAMVLLAAGALRERGGRGGGTETPLDGRWTFCLVALLVVAAAALPVIAHRPDTDDAFYISVANHALSHPHQEVLRWDTLYDLPGLPILLKVYRVESWELLMGLLVKLTPLSSLVVAHLVLPPVWAALTILAWAAFLRALTPRAWPAALLLLFILMLVLGEDHHSIGNFAFIRMQQGKAVMMTLQVPLVCLFAWRFGTWGRKADLLLLLAAQIGGVGISCTGLLVMPAAAGMGLLSTWMPDRRWPTRLLIGLVTTLYPFAAALLVRSGLDTLVASLHDWPAEKLPEVLATVLGPYGRFLLLGGPLAAWSMVSSPMARRWLLGGALILFAGILNPWLAPWISQYVTSPPAFWRLPWCYPFALVAAVLLAEICCLPRHPVWRITSVAALSAALIFASVKLDSFVLRPANSVTLRFAGLDAPPADVATARLVRQSTPPGAAALAPEAVSAWLVALLPHPPLVYVRQHYLLYVRRGLGDAEVDRRLRLWEQLDDASARPDPGFLVEELGRLHVGSVTLHHDLRSTPALEESLLQLHWRCQPLYSYDVWTAPSGADSSRAPAAASRIK